MAFQPFAFGSGQRFIKRLVKSLAHRTKEWVHMPLGNKPLGADIGDSRPYFLNCYNHRGSAVWVDFNFGGTCLIEGENTTGNKGERQ